MKKIIQVLVIYAILIFGACVGLSFLSRHIPDLLVKDIKLFYFSRGLLWFLQILPAVLISGFMIGCAIEWKNNTIDSRARYSPAMMERFKKVIKIGVVLICILTLSAEVFIPEIKASQTEKENNPELINKFMSLGKSAANEKNFLLAYQYAQQALNINPKDKELLEFYNYIKDEKDISISKQSMNSPLSYRTVEKIKDPIKEEQGGLTIRQMIEKSTSAASNKNWFDAHYWATLAVLACNGTNTNLQIAQEAANNAWNHLSVPVVFDNEEMNSFYAQKKKGYEALNRGDELQAYYIYNNLAEKSSEYAADHDVKKYLQIAKQRVEAQYFFIDETEDIKKLETNHNVYFCLPFSDGRKLVVYVQGVATLKHSDGIVRYLDGLTVVEYDAYGNFVKSMTVPFAKMLEELTAFYNEEQLERLGLSKNVKSIPVLQMQSVDRRTEGIVSKPVYSYSPSGVPEYIALKFADMEHIDYSINTDEIYSDDSLLSEDENVWLVPMPYNDFALVNEASSGPEKISFFSLIKFLPKSVAYGYSQEVYAQTLVRRGVYPLYLLILIIFIASLGWNYRIGEKDIFQFKWLFLFPLFSFVVYIVLECIQYIFTLLNYMVVGLCGSYALIVAFVLYIFILLAFSINFLARKQS